MDAEDILNEFTDVSGLISVERFGSGHIHDTFLARFTHPKPDLVLQKINHGIFRNITGLMNNIQEVTRFTSQYLNDNPGIYPGIRPLILKPTYDDKACFESESHEFWRCFYRIDNTSSFDVPPQKSLVGESGKMLGRFQAILSNMDPGLLVETIPAFHDLLKRMDTFHDVVIANRAGRVDDAKPELKFVMERAGGLLKLDSLVKSGTIPVRIVHNDPKFNNFLFNSENKAISLIDLDTVMPGTILYDFGDAIRTATNAAAEDEPDPGRAAIDMEAFRYFTTGYLEIARSFLTRYELDNLALSCRYMAFIIGLRFLTDHFDGDHYYHTQYPGHNLARARVQFNLVKSMEERSGEMDNIIANIF